LEGETMLRHVVFINLLEPTPENMQETVRRLMAMDGKIPQLISVEAGFDVLRSERSYDICLITTFESLEAMKEYQVHPVHQDVLAYLSTVRKSSSCVDYEFTTA
jgi:Stress responsive A/B Barrel Domain